MLMAINLDNYKDGNGNLQGSKKLIEDITYASNTNETNIGTNMTALTNVRNVTNRFSGVASGFFNANVGTSFPGIAVNTTSAGNLSTLNLYQVNAIIQTSGNSWMSLSSIMLLQWDGSRFQVRGSREVSRTTFNGEPTTNAITFETANNRFQVEVPNLSAAYNNSFSYVKLI